MAEAGQVGSEAPPVTLWRTWGLRLIFAAMAIVLSTEQWSYILGGTAAWSEWKGLGHCMLAILGLLAILGVFHPVKLLPLMLFEIAWKTVWLLGIALPAWLGDRVVPDIVNVPASAIGIVVVSMLMPWRYVWWRYVVQPVEPWRRDKNAARVNRQA